MSPEFIAIIIFGPIQLAGLLILGLMLRQISGSTGIHVLHGRRIEDVLLELREAPHS
jgi:hypothetical protein